MFDHPTPESNPEDAANEFDTACEEDASLPANCSACVKINHVRKSARVRERREMGPHVSLKKAVKQYGEHAHRAIKAELQQMIDRGVWLPVRPEQLSHRKFKKIIRSSMFLKEKFLSNGDFEKLKARLVALGNMQEKEVFDSVASPTISLVAIFIIIALAAIENRFVATINVGAAYLEVTMDHQTTTMTSLWHWTCWWHRY